MKTLLRLLAGLSLCGVLAAGVLIGQWLLPVQATRTVDRDFGKGMESLEIDAGLGVSLQIINRDRVARPAGFRSVTTGTLAWPTPTYSEDAERLTAGCPRGSVARCQIELEVFVPGRLQVILSRDSHPDSLVIDSDVAVRVAGG